MSEKVLRIMLGELDRIRVTCTKCDSSIEVPIGEIERTFQEFKCPSCRNILLEMDMRNNPFFKLQQAIQTLGIFKQSIKVEMVIPDKS